MKLFFKKRSHQRPSCFPLLESQTLLQGQFILAFDFTGIRLFLLAVPLERNAHRYSQSSHTFPMAVCSQVLPLSSVA